MRALARFLIILVAGAVVLIMAIAIEDVLTAPESIDSESLVSVIGQHQSDDVIRYVLTRGADPNRLQVGISPLISAASLDRASTVDILLKHGANPAEKIKSDLNLHQTWLSPIRSMIGSRSDDGSLALVLIDHGEIALICEAMTTEGEQNYSTFARDRKKPALTRVLDKAERTRGK